MKLQDVGLIEFTAINSLFAQQNLLRFVAEYYTRFFVVHIIPILYNIIVPK